MRLRTILTGTLLTCALLGTGRAQTSNPPPPGSPAAWSNFPSASSFVPGGPSSSPAPGSPAAWGSSGLTGSYLPGSPSVFPPGSPSNVIHYNPPINFYWGPDGPVPYSPPLVVIGGGAYWPYYPPVPTVRGYYPEELYPPAPPQVPLALRVPQPAPRPKRIDPGRADELITLGDRHFRAKDLRRATERYAEAARLHPGSAAVRVRLAQIALARSQYTEAANRLREALAAEPEWLRRAGDIQNLYGEPADFKAQIDKLERHLQAHPNDRDAWLVLGAQWFLSGRTRQAADVFLRLSDRKPDPALSAFLDASRAEAE